MAVRMSDTEAVMWAVEKDPALRSDFCNLTFVDRVPDRRRLQRKLANAFEAMPRLAQRVVSAPLRIVPPEWADDPDLDLDYHIRSIGLPAPGDERTLLEVCESIADAPFDRSRPLWQFTIITGLADGRAALLQKMHHTITDGVGGLKLSLAMVDFEPDDGAADGGVGGGGSAGGVAGAGAAERADADKRVSPLDVLRGAVADATARGVGTATNVASRAGHVATHPQELPGRVVDAARMATSLRRQLLVSDRAHSDVMVERSLRRRFELRALPLPETKHVAKELGGTVNDLFVTGLTGALRRYHLRHGSDCSELRMAMPISTRARGDDAPNRFSPARVLVPLVPDDPADRFTATHERLAGVKGEAALNAMDAFAGVVSSLPTSLLVTLARSQVRTIDFAASNLRGSPTPLYLAGARILANHPLGPRTGSALNVTVLSYCDEMHVGVNLDPAAITDIDAFMADLDTSFAELLASA
jgi:WS/DGAT/MGAT family acyltransferase